MSETPVISPLLMDRSEPIGNSTGPDGRRVLHVQAHLTTPTQPVDYDSGEVLFPSATQETYIYKLNGATVKTVSITYTDSTKETIASWAIT